MLFNSFSYAIFLPVVFILYWIRTPWKERWQNIVLLAASYFFYCCWDWRFAFLIAFTSASSYFAGTLIEDRKAHSKLWLVLNLVLNLAILGFFKYFGFFVDSFCSLAGLIGFAPHRPSLEIILPVGISFYTFQSLGYSIDVYRGDVVASRNPLKFFAFVSFFPQLVAGPIERARNLLPQFDSQRYFNHDKAVEGLGMIAWGIFLKLVIADRLAVYVDNVWKNLDKAAGLPCVIAVLFFAVQLYTDFYSYSQIARGSANLFGMSLMENFRRPYLSDSFKMFWKRWHISLSSWFMDYVYIPLGGNRRGSARKVLNLCIVFALSGLWHGASWTFFAWGLLCAAFLICLDGVLKKTGRIPGFNPFIVTLCWAFSLILFRAQDFPSALEMFRGLGFGNAGAITSFGLKGAEMAFTFCLLVILLLQEILWERRGEAITARFVSLAAWKQVIILSLAVIIIILLGQYGIGNDSRFIYFQF